MREVNILHQPGRLDLIEIQHEKAKKRFFLLTTGLIGLTGVSLIVATAIGRVPISIADTLTTLISASGLSMGRDVDDSVKTVIVDLRLSRVVLSAFVGMALSVSGAAFQGILKNPLADPFTIGVSTGAAFGASLAIFFGVSNLTLLGLGLIPVVASLGALTALFVVLFLSRVDGRVRRDTMVLAGIVVATFLGALISLVKSLDEESVSSIVFWVMGSFQGRGWSHLGFALPYIIIGLILVVVHSRDLDLMTLGDSQAKQLGVNVSRTRRRVLIGASLLTAGSVSVSGVIGFVGLVAPHLIRLTVGPDHGRLFVLSGIAGMLALIWSDVGARIILPEGEELPVGVITALLGGPFFCLLLKKRRVESGID